MQYIPHADITIPQFEPQLDVVNFHMLLDILGYCCINILNIQCILVQLIIWALNFSSTISSSGSKFVFRHQN